MSETEVKVIIARLEADKRYYDGVLRNLQTGPVSPVGNVSVERLIEKAAEIVDRLGIAITTAKGFLQNA